MRRALIEQLARGDGVAAPGGRLGELEEVGDEERDTFRALGFDARAIALDRDRPRLKGREDGKRHDEDAQRRRHAHADPVPPDEPAHPIRAACPAGPRPGGHRAGGRRSSASWPAEP